MSSKENTTNFMSADTICSDFGPPSPQNKLCHCFHCFLYHYWWQYILKLVENQIGKERSHKIWKYILKFSSDSNIAACMKMDVYFKIWTEINITMFHVLCCAVLSHSVCPTLRDPMDCSLPGCSVYGVSPHKYTGVGCHMLLQEIFPTQGLNPGLPHYKQILFFFNLYFFLFFSFICISWRLITLQYFSGFCHTLTWISHGFTCIPHPDPPSHFPLYLIQADSLLSELPGKPMFHTWLYIGGLWG